MFLASVWEKVGGEPTLVAARSGHHRAAVWCAWAALVVHPVGLEVASERVRPSVPYPEVCRPDILYSLHCAESVMALACASGSWPDLLRDPGWTPCSDLALAASACQDNLPVLSSKMDQISCFVTLRTRENPTIHVLSKCLPQKCQVRQFADTVLACLDDSTRFADRVSEWLLAMLFGAYRASGVRVGFRRMFEWHSQRFRNPLLFEWICKAAIKRHRLLAMFACREYLTFMVDDSPAWTASLSASFRWGEFTHHTHAAADTLRRMVVDYGWVSLLGPTNGVGDPPTNWPRSLEVQRHACLEADQGSFGRAVTSTELDWKKHNCYEGEGAAVMARRSESYQPLHQLRLSMDDGESGRGGGGGLDERGVAELALSLRYLVVEAELEWTIVPQRYIRILFLANELKTVCSTENECIGGPEGGGLGGLGGGRIGNRNEALREADKVTRRFKILWDAFDDSDTKGSLTKLSRKLKQRESLLQRQKLKRDAHGTKKNTTTTATAIATANTSREGRKREPSNSLGLRESKRAYVSSITEMAFMRMVQMRIKQIFYSRNRRSFFSCITTSQTLTLAANSLPGGSVWPKIRMSEVDSWAGQSWHRVEHGLSDFHLFLIKEIVAAHGKMESDAKSALDCLLYLGMTPESHASISSTETDYSEGRLDQTGVEARLTEVCGSHPYSFAMLYTLADAWQQHLVARLDDLPACYVALQVKAIKLRLGLGDQDRIPIESGQIVYCPVCQHVYGSVGRLNLAHAVDKVKEKNPKTPQKRKPATQLVPNLRGSKKQRVPDRNGGNNSLRIHTQLPFATPMSQPLLLSPKATSIGGGGATRTVGYSGNGITGNDFRGGFKTCKHEGVKAHAFIPEGSVNLRQILLVGRVLRTRHQCNYYICPRCGVIALFDDQTSKHTLRWGIVCGECTSELGSVGTCEPDFKWSN
jgi:hypothetical protein